MGLLASGQAMLGVAMEGESQPITYRRDATSLYFSAMPSGPQETTDDGGIGLGIDTSERDFSFAVSKLGALDLPVVGDEIDWAIGGKTYYFRVLSMNGTRCFDWLDNHQLRIAVHAKLSRVS